jgi:cytochrome b
MTMMQRIRAYHAALATLSVAAYISAEWDLVHALLGYAVAAILALRVVAALSGMPQLGLSRFYPQFEGLRLDNAFAHPAISRTLLLGIAVCLIAVSVTGIALDGGRTLGVAEIAQPAFADEREAARGDEEEGVVGEAHEFFANALVLLVAGHVGYLFAFKRPLARFMLFLDARRPARPAP